jgi:hypothetical protein
VEIVPYTPAHRDAVERLNARLAEAGSEWSFPPRERPAAAEERPVWTESFVAVDGDDVCGGYILKHQKFFLDGRPADVGSLQLPLSLGEIDSQYANVSVALLFDAIRRSPYLYSLGLGSEETQFARLLTAARWQHIAVPFYFSVKSGNAFARNIRLPAGRARMQTVLRALGSLRLAGLALGLRARLRDRSAPASARTGSDARARELAEFDSAVDELFTKVRTSYVVVADRSASALREVYPPDEPRFLRLGIESDGRQLGWALVLDTAMKGDRYFGDMRVGSIADCLAAPEDCLPTIAAADAFLARRGVDIVVSNQFHPRWCEALEGAGYERGPSNFFFYYSEELGNRLSSIADWQHGSHLNRGDGEGPGHLLAQSG